MNQYWVVGAMSGGKTDQLNLFVKRGYWYCWDPAKNRDRELPHAVQRLFPLIQAGDRIAVKKMLGTGSKNIAIRALGVVTDVDRGEWRVYVKWLLKDVSREVPIMGCMGSIHGPFAADEWRDSVFSI